MTARIIVPLIALALPASALADVAKGVARWKAGDFTAAVAEWEGAAGEGDPEAQVRLAEAYLTGKGVPADAAKARDLLEKAAAKGQPLAEVNLGLVLFRAGETDRAFPLLEKAAARGEPRAQYVLGTALFNGDRIPKDRVRAYALMSKASDNLPQAKASLSRMGPLLTADQRKSVTALTGATIDSPALAPSSAPPVGWKVQLGAFGSQTAAEGQWRRFAALPAFVEAQPAYSKVRSVVRLQAGPFRNKTAAETACNAARGAGGDCFTVQP